MFQFTVNRGVRFSSSSIRSASSSSNIASVLYRSTHHSLLSALPAQVVRSNVTISGRTNGLSLSVPSCRNHRPSSPPPFRSSKCNFSSTNASSSSSPSWLEGDRGTLGTKIYHSMNLVLAAMVPVYFLTPERYTNGYISKTIGFLMATSISLHTYIGLNYVCRDYVPKISSKLLGPARIVTAAFSFIMLVGMSKIAFYSPNGIKGIISGLWISSKTIKKNEVDEEITKS